MPFLPRMWAGAARWRTSQVVGPLLILILVAAGALAAYRSWDMRRELQRWAKVYDAKYAAIIVEKGEVRVEGDQVIQILDGDTTILVDPNETVPAESITTPRYLIVRKHEIINKRPFRTEIMNVADVARFLGQGPTRIDGEAIRAFDAAWGLLLQIGVLLLILPFVLAKEAVGCVLYSLAGGGIILGTRGRGLDLDYEACLRVALSVSSLTVVIQTVLSLLGTGPGLLLGLFLRLVIITFLALWVVGRA